MLKKLTGNFTAIGLAGALLLTGCGGSAGDPKTLTRDELNPPSGLVTVTGDKQIELRWLGANTEDGLQGYQVFGYTENTNDGTSGPLVTVLSKVAYPKPGVNTAIPRCKDNDEVFRLFGFTKNSDAKCKGDDSAEEKKSFSGDASSLYAEAGEDDMANKLTCEAGSSVVSNANVSLPITRSLGVQRCVVKKVAGVDLENGKSYVFVVAAVKGDKFNKLSWTSNFVKDTPAIKIFGSTVTFEPQKFKSFVIDTAAPAAITAEGGDCSSAASACSLSGENTATPTAIYLGRPGTGTYPQRILISTPAGGDISILQRGAETTDPVAAAGTIATSTPGDRAASTDTYFKGEKLPVYGNQVFDIQIVRGGKTHYGKIVFGDPTGTAANANITMDVTILMQPKAGEFDYFAGDLN